MTTAGGHSSNERRVPRCPLAVPVKVTVQRSGMAHGIPGRSLDLGEGGIAAVLAGEVHTGDPVGVEFLLPELGLGLRTKAVVRHHANLRCGLEFTELSLEQQAMIRRWTRRILESQPRQKAASVAQPVTVRTEAAPVERFQMAQTALKSAVPKRRSAYRAVRVAVFGLLIAAAVLWWRWQRGWEELSLKTQPPYATRRVKLPPGVAEQLILHKVEAIYPEGMADSGTVLLDVVIAPDGTVADQRPVSGPEGLTRAAMEAMKEWRFQPYRPNGENVEVEATLLVDFQEN